MTPITWGRGSQRYDLYTSHLISPLNVFVRAMVGESKAARGIVDGTRGKFDSLENHK